MIKLNLGCGNKYLKGYINIDINKSVKADKYLDLNKFPYPLKDNFADGIVMDNVLEHLDDIVLVMREIHRILKPKGIVQIFLPYAKSDGAFQDPTHKHFFTEKSMDYFTQDYEYGYYVNFKFKIIEKKLYSMNKTRLSKLRYLIPGKRILNYLLFNIYDTVYFKLQAIK